MISLFFGWINEHGYPITRKDVIILTYGGLRGAIALSLALMVVTDNYSDRFKDLVLFYLIAMIVATVLINGCTIKYVMQYIDFIKVSNLQKKVRNQLNKTLVTESLKQMQLLKNDRFFNLANWDDVQK